MRQRRRRAPISARTPRRKAGLGTLGLVALILSAWAVERWGPGLIPPGWSLDGPRAACRVKRVLDGDSMQLVCSGRPVEVRLYCIDAPEKDQRPWGDRSRAHLKSITPAEVELVEIEIDRFGRTVGEVVTSDRQGRRSLGVEQVRSGQAAVYDRYCDDPRFLRAEREAQEADLGIWKTPGSHQRPWVFRHRQAPR